MAVQPNRKEKLAFILYHDSKTNRLVETLKSQKLTPSFATLVSSIQDGRLTLESILNSFPNPDFPVEQAQANLDKIMDAASKTERVQEERPKYRDDLLEETLLEAIDLGLKVNNPAIETTDADANKLDELRQKIQELLPKSERQKRKKTKTKTLLGFFNRLFDKFTLTFNNIPENKEDFHKILQKVAEIPIEEKVIDGKKLTLYLGRVTGDKILTNFDDANEFLQFLDKNAEKGKEIRESLAQFEPNIGKFVAAKTKKKKRKQVSKEILENLVAEGVSFTASRITTFDDVQNYLDAIEKVPYDITPLIPRTLSVTKGERTNLPPTFFLTRESARSAKTGRGQKSLVLNPYVRVLLQSTFTQADWFSTYFDNVRVTEIVQKNLAELMVLDDIYDMIKLNKESKYGFERTRFGRLSLGENREAARVKIRKVINEDERLGDAFGAQERNLRANLLTELQADFLIDEAYELQKLWESNEDISDFEGDLEVIPKDNKYATIKVGGNEVNYQELVELLKDYEVSYKPSNFRQLIQNTIRNDLDENKFVQYILSLSKEELENIVKGEIDDSVKVMDKLNPKNSLIFLSTVSERMTGENKNLVSDALEEIAKDKYSVAEKQEKAAELSDKMLGFLRDLQNTVYSAFQRELEDFSTNYIRIAGRQPDKAIRAIRSFIAKGLLSGGGRYGL